MESKVCNKCNIKKPINEFRHRNGKCTLNYCLECERQQMKDHHYRTWKEYYAKNKEKLSKRDKEKYYNILKPRNMKLYGRILEPNKAKENYTKVTTKCLSIYGTKKPPHTLDKNRKRNRELRAKVIMLYGGKCECCGEDKFEFLNIDHKIKTYYKDKKRGYYLIQDAIKEYELNGYPNSKYRLLCWNCNMSIGFYGYCPHHNKVDKNVSTMKLEAIEVYGGKCVICNEDNPEFLTIDHIKGNGTIHRIQVGDIYKWLKKNNYPKDDFRLLCSNCNCSKLDQSRGGMS